MRYSIDRKSSQSAYMQLYEQMREDIVSGVYPYGMRMPSKRLVASEVGVSVITVEHTYGILCDEGYIDSRERSGYYVIYRDTDVYPVAEEEKSQAPETESERFSPGMTRGRIHSDEQMPYNLMAKTIRRVLTNYGEKAFQRSPSGGLPELRAVIASYLARSRGIRVKPEQVIIGSGAEYLYSLVVQMLGRDRVIALEDPSYEKIRRMYEANGVTCELLKMGRHGIRSSELARSRASVLHVTPYNSYPSGVSASASKRREYINWAESRNGILIEDDFDSEYTVSTKAEDTLFSLEPKKTVIYLNTFTETIGPAVRIGYMLLPEQMTDLFREKVGFYSSTVPTFEQYVITELIRSGDFERHINRVRRARRRSEQNGGDK
ncbi:MAG: PLP-dependent aminotransferase family protein [Eubacteriales bacterium]|jgi:GntR family transcriptional regulator/MocR family aminotransferase